MRCDAVTFHNRDGMRLFGIVHLPQTERPHPVPFILLSPGIKSRVAPHRLYVKLARHLACLGFMVLRFDFAGLGDSEGSVGESAMADFYGTVQSGRYVDDTCAAMDWLQREYGASKFILAGLCGGAITGLLAGAQDSRVDSLVALGLPVLLDSQGVDPTRYLTVGELKQWRDGYLSKIADVRSWLRLMTFRSNYRVMLRAFAVPFRQRGRSRGDAPATVAMPAENFNPLVPQAFRAMASGRNMLLIFGEADRLYSIFQERLAQPYQTDLQRHRDQVEVQVIPDANHVFSLPEWEEAMHRCVEVWIRRHYCPEPTAGLPSSK